MTKKNKKRNIFLLIFILVVIIGAIAFFRFFIFYKSQSENQEQYIFSRIKSPQAGINVLISEPYSNNPDKSLLFIRCIGMPGDTLQIIDTKVFINSKPEKLQYELKQKYRINCFLPEANKKLADRYDAIDTVNIMGLYELVLTDKQVQHFLADSLLMVKQIIADKRFRNQKIFPYSYMYNWNEDNFGAIVIPQKGFEIILNNKTHKLYKNIILNYEKKNIIYKEHKFYIDNKEIKFYTFEQNYYFVMNDNRADYHDSRIWGMVPKSMVLASEVYSF